MREDGDFYFLTFEHQPLTPEQWEQLKRAAIRRAHQDRARALRDLLAWVATSLSAAARGGWHAVRVLRNRATNVGGDWWGAYAIRRERRMAIRELGALDDRMLKDIGLGRSEIESVIHDPERLMTRGLAAARPRQCAARAGISATSRQGARRVIAPLIDRSAA